MEDKRHFRELYVGCECFCTHHIAHFLFFPKTEKDRDNYEEELYLTVQRQNLDSFFKRLKLAFKLVTRQYEYTPEPVFYGMDFQDEDLEKMSQFLSYFTEKLNTDTQNPQPIMVDLIDNTREKYKIEINHTHYFDGDFNLGWELFFSPHYSIWKRLIHAHQYLWNKENGSIQFTLNQYLIRDLREIIEYSLEKWKNK